MKYLFVLNDYYPLKNASGVCVESVIRELKKNNNDIHIICYMDCEKDIDDHGFAIHGIKANDYVNTSNFRTTKYDNAFRKFLWLVQLCFTYPIYYPVIANRLLQKCDEVIKQDSIAHVITVINPIETALTAIKIKKLNPNVTVTLYELDSITDLDSRNSGIRKILNFKRKQLEKKVYGSVDTIIHMKCHSKHFESNYYDKYRTKMRMADFPLYIEQTMGDNVIEIGDKLSFVFSGALIRGIRNPEYAIRFFSVLSKKHSISVDFFSRGDYEEFLLNCSQMNPVIHQKGYVSTEILNYAMQECDFLVSIGNQMSNMVPSKIYGYISRKKPIIHFCSIDDDPCIDILKDYKLALIIRCTKPVDDAICDFDKYLKRINGTICERIESKNFELNRPSYTANLLN